MKIQTSTNPFITQNILGDIMTGENIFTSIRVSKETKYKLDDIKCHPRESHEQVLKRLHEFWVNAEKFMAPMTDDLKNTIKSGLEHKFGVPVTEIEDLGRDGTKFHLEGDPEGTPVWIPVM